MQGQGLFHASSATTGRTAVPVPQGNGCSELRYPSFLPDGRRFVALGVVGQAAGPLDRAKSDIAVGSIDKPGELSVVVRVNVSSLALETGFLSFVFVRSLPLRLHARTTDLMCSGRPFKRLRTHVANRRVPAAVVVKHPDVVEQLHP